MDLLSTGRVATLLGVSRQHVVDLCARGEVSCVWVGRHRRVPTSEVDRLLSPALTRSEARSLWLHRAVLGELATDPARVLEVARQNVDRWRTMHRPDGMTSGYLSAWERILDLGAEAAAEAMVDTSPRGRELRQNSPFAGLLSEAKRAQVRAAFEVYGDSTDPLVVM